MRPPLGLYVVKLLATLSITVLLTVVFTGILTPPFTWAGGSSLEVLRVAGRPPDSCPGSGRLLLFVRPAELDYEAGLIVGIIYSVIFEGLLANLPFGVRLLTIIYYARLIAYRTLPFIDTNPNGTFNVSAEAWQLNIRTTPISSNIPRNRLASSPSDCQRACTRSRASSARNANSTSRRRKELNFAAVVLPCPTFLLMLAAPAKLRHLTEPKEGVLGLCPAKPGNGVSIYDLDHYDVPAKVTLLLLSAVTSLVSQTRQPRNRK